jgi:alpha,alpha-trehalose phosphorylase
MVFAIKKAIYPYEEWIIRETNFDIATNYRDETIFAVANGYIGMRGSLEEGYSGPKNTSFNGTYINGFYESYDIEYPEGGYGFAKVGQAMLNVADGKIIKVFVEDEPFDLLKGEILEYERILDMREGLVKRYVKWRSPKGRIIEVNIKRMVSFRRKHLAIVSFSVRPLNFEGNIKFISQINGDVSKITESDDVRVSTGLKGKVLETIEKGGEGTTAFLM